ncbi:MAG: hypothetical protein PF694_09805 [Bacteroidetes bacterium]|jgi:hypothetical protein|nr:hypothetical protein [Bacteroidota bacterium]
MKRNIKQILILAIIIFASTQLIAQGPPPPPGDPSAGGEIVGGGAPIGSGIALLLGLGAAYGGRKVYQYWKSQKEELED